MSKKLTVILSGTLLILIFALGIYVYKSHQANKYWHMAQDNASTFVRDYSPTYGADEAKVWIVEFFDPACRACGTFHFFVKDLMTEHPGKLKLVARYAPFQRGSDAMVKILEAARRQGLYWEALEVMYSTQSQWASHSNPQPQLIWKFLEKTQLDLEKIKRDMKDPKLEKIIMQDLIDAKTLNIRVTPVFFVNGKPLPSFGKKQLQALVEAEIAKAYP
jgi:protein-disulfide isomerase